MEKPSLDTTRYVIVRLDDTPGRCSLRLVLPCGTVFRQERRCDEDLNDWLSRRLAPRFAASLASLALGQSAKRKRVRALAAAWTDDVRPALETVDGRRLSGSHARAWVSSSALHVRLHGDARAAAGCASYVYATVLSPVELDGVVVAKGTCCCCCCCCRYAVRVTVQTARRVCRYWRLHRELASRETIRVWSMRGIASSTTAGRP